MVFDWLRRRLGSQAKVSEQERFVDIDLPLHSCEKSDAGTIEITARGLLNGRKVGIGFRLGSEWKSQELEDAPVTLFWGDGEIRSLGPESHQFVEALSELYGHQPASPQMPEIVLVSVVGLDNDPRLLPNDSASMKLFIEPENDDLYGEVFLNINIRERILEFHEKDPEYRANLLRALGQTT